MMEADFRALLAGDTALAALVGDRIDWGIIPQGIADPNIVLYRIASAPAYTMQGADELDSVLVQASIRALSHASALAVRDALVARVSGFKGTVGVTDFRGIFIRAERHGSEKPNNVLYHTVQLDLDIWARAA